MTTALPPSANLHQQPRHFYRWLGLLILLVAGLGAIVFGLDWTSTGTLFREARAALAAGNFERAEQLGRRLMRRTERRGEGALIAGEAAAKLQRFEVALEYLNAIPRSDALLYVTGRLAVARIQTDDLSQLSLAEPALREALQVDPDSVEAHERMSFILGLTGRSWEAIPHRLVLIQQAQFPIHHLTLLALGSSAAENPEIIQKLVASSPNDVLVKCAASRVAQRDGRIETAELLLDEVLLEAPTLLAAQAWRGELIAIRGEATDAFLQWHGRLPKEADEFPDIWYVRGLWAMQHADPRVAVRCFWECLRRDANHQTAAFHLGNVLQQLGEEQLSKTFRDHARLLNDLITAAKTVEISGSATAGRRAAATCDALGLGIEARAWREILRRTDPRFRQSAPKPEEVAIDTNTQRMDPQFDPTRRVDLAGYPLPAWPRAGTSRPATQSTRVASHSGIAFVDSAAKTGINFEYRNGSQPKTDGEYMYEFSGGGVAVLDYDMDGWPDLYFTQASDSPPGTPQQTHLDRLYRNRGAASQFEDITGAATIDERGFSHGCAVGDFDNDGFPDLYVSNIGANACFHNNGDGTFTDVTARTGTAGDRWTTSCAWADFNGDGLSDLFVANYLTGDDLFTQPCRMPDGSTRLCTPHEFPAAHDQLYVNLGDGRFADQSQMAGIEVPEGKGLGVVAAIFDAANPGGIHPGIFVANDTVPNFYFLNTATARGQPAHFQEQAFVNGLAVDGDGQPQACMGVAAGDPNGDGLLDLFVTNFHNESNTLYVQQPGGLFVDGTRRSGLREPSFAMLGFGTQFLDADLDGWEDLAVTNGHVGNLKHHGIPYEMRPQFFHNVGNGRFAELLPATVGPFFAGEYLGRGLARLDWNRDGRDDFVISHLKSPAELLTNTTSTTGHSLAIQLRGITTDRDAVGSIVTVTVGSRRLVRQLSSGDGYQASNQRQLVFGLDHAEQIDRLEVRWATGITQVFAAPAINTENLLIEGREAAVVLPRP